MNTQKIQSASSKVGNTPIRQEIRFSLNSLIKANTLHAKRNMKYEIYVRIN